MYRPILAHILFTLMRKLCTLAFIFFLVKKKTLSHDAYFLNFSRRRTIVKKVITIKISQHIKTGFLLALIARAPTTNCNI